jgi:membrane associated rhomboid family serine protease
MTPTSVGMRCPECARERTKVKTIRTPRSGVTMTEVLIAINVIVFIAETASGSPLGGGITGTVLLKGVLFGPYITQSHEYWRLLTAGFLHDGLLHILFNMVFLYFIGRILEPGIGRLNFTIVYFVSLLAGSFGALLFEPQAGTVGASGACFGVLGALIVVAHARGISIWQSGLGMTLLINIVFSLSIQGISIGGHLGGLVAGLIMGWVIIEFGERRRMSGVVLASAVILAVVAVIGSLAVAGSAGLTPNGLGFGL